MIISLIAALASAQPTTQLASVPPVCERRSAVEAGGMHKSDDTAKLQRLDQLPPADMILTVLRTTGKCSTPVIVRYGIGQRAK